MSSALPYVAGLVGLGILVTALLLGVYGNRREHQEVVRRRRALGERYAQGELIARRVRTVTHEDAVYLGPAELDGEVVKAAGIFGISPDEVQLRLSEQQRMAGRE